MFTGGLHQAGLVGVYYPALLFYMSSRYYTEALCLQSEHSIDSLCDFSSVVMKCSDETAWGTRASGVSQFHATVEKQGMELWSSASLFPFTHFKAFTQERVPLTMGGSSHPNQCNQNNSPTGMLRNRILSRSQFTLSVTQARPSSQSPDWLSLHSSFCFSSFWPEHQKPGIELTEKARRAN